MSSRFECQPGQLWLDTDGAPIEAHGGGILEHGEIFYWYGEDHQLGIGNKTGIACYSSRDLYDWKREGVALPVEALPSEFSAPGVCERPKVLYNAQTSKFVLWAHMDDGPYQIAAAGVATCDTPNGVFTFQGYSRPIRHDFGCKPDDPMRQSELGGTFKDMTLFQDDDGAAYVFYSSEDNVTMYVSRLNDEFTAVQTPSREGETWARILRGRDREAPSVFKHQGRYYLLTSACTGWTPNPAEYAVADHPLGPWITQGNPCRGRGAEYTFHSQSTFAFPAPGQPPGSFIYMGDRWVGEDLAASRYVWLPFVMGDDSTLTLEWLERWNLSIFAGKPAFLLPPVVHSESEKDTRLLWEPVPGADAYRVYRNGWHLANTVETTFPLPPTLAGRAYNYTVTAMALGGPTSPPSAPCLVFHRNARSLFLSELDPDFAQQGYRKLMPNRNVLDLPLSIGNRFFTQGLGTHAVSEIVYGIGGQYAAFEAWVGTDGMFPRSTVEFQVFADDRKVYDSGLMRHETPARPVHVTLAGVFDLRLTVTDGGDGNFNDYAVWGDARLIATAD